MSLVNYFSFLFFKHPLCFGEHSHFFVDSDQVHQAVDAVDKGSSPSHHLRHSVESTKEQLVEIFGQSLHRIGESKPKESVVERVLKVFPAAMKVKNKKERLPDESNTSKYEKYVGLRVNKMLFELEQ